MTNDVESGVSTTLVVISADPSRLSTLLQVGAKFMRKKSNGNKINVICYYCKFHFISKRSNATPVCCDLSEWMSANVLVALQITKGGSCHSEDL